MAGPSKIVAVYAPGWSTSDFNVSNNYNVVIPFACIHAGNGKLAWEYSTTGVQAARAEGQKVILSTGGAGQGINFSSRTVSQNFVNSFIEIATRFGGVDGIDFNTFEADAAPNLPEYQWISRQLKAKFGPNFVVMSPPAPWSDRDKAFCKAMLAAGDMDFCGPQFYDGPGLADTAYIVARTKEWVANVAGGDASKIIVGFGIGGTNYSTLQGCIDAFKQIKAALPNIRGVFLWQRAADPNGSGFAASLKPLVGAATDGPVTPPPPPSGAVVKSGTASYAYGGANTARDENELVGFTRTSTQTVTPTNPWGAEATVVGGKVTALNDRQATESAAGTPIPAGSIVISGHGAARDWILANAKVGASVTVPGAPAAPTDPGTGATLPTALAPDAPLATVVSSYNKLLSYLKGKGV